MYFGPTVVWFLDTFPMTLKRFHVFVSNRVQQIRDVIDPSQWRYFDTRNNPADIAS